MGRVGDWVGPGAGTEGAATVDWAVAEGERMAKVKME